MLNNWVGAVLAGIIVFGTAGYIMYIYISERLRDKRIKNGHPKDYLETIEYYQMLERKKREE